MLRKQWDIPPEAAKAFVREHEGVLQGEGPVDAGRGRRETGLASEAALAARHEAADYRRERAVPADEG